MIVKDGWIAGEDLLTYDMPCDCKRKNAVKNGKAFPKRLLEAHGGKIAINASAVYQNVGSHNGGSTIEIKCTVCNHEWEASAHNLVNKKHGCPKCANQRVSDNAGKTRSPRATAEEKAYAQFLRNEKKWSYRAIGNFLGGRGSRTIQRWCDPEKAEEQRIRNAEWLKENAERHRAACRRYFTEFEHGREIMRAGYSKRRALKHHAIFTVEVDGVFHEVNMWEHIKEDKSGMSLFTDPNANDAWKDYSTRAEKLGKIAGVKYHVDHLVPLSRGGEHCPENFALKPASENLSKNNKVIHEDYALFAKRIFNIN